MRVVLRNRVYRRLFTAQVVALGGTGLATVALGLLAYDLAAGRAGEVLGTALAVKMAAYVLVSPVVGAWADRVPRRVLMVGADVVRALVVLALPAVGAIWQVYALIAILQAASATFTPTFQSVIPDVVPDERDYTDALSASQLAVALESVLSPLLAALLLTVVSFSDLFVGTAVGFVCSAVLVARSAVPAAARSSRTRFRDRLGAGVAIFAATPRLRAVLALNMVVAAAGAVTLVSTVNVVRDLYGGSDADVALLLAVSGAGTAVAALAVPLLLRRATERRVLATGTVLTVVAMAGAVALSTLHGSGRPLAVAVWLLIGVGGGLVLVPVGRVVRDCSTTGDRPAVFAAQFSLSHLCWLLTYPVAGWVGSLAGFTAAWSVLGALVVVSAGLAAVLWPRGLPGALTHAHDATADHRHVHDAEHDGLVWVHTHHVVIDENHPRWPRDLVA